MPDGKQSMPGRLSLRREKMKLQSMKRNLAEAKEAYENGKKEAEAEIKDGEIRSKMQSRRLRILKMPKWYVNDRKHTF